MFQMDLNARFHNKAFLMALVSAILLLLKNFGLGQYIPENIDYIINGLITIGILLGVIADTSTPGISDKVVSDATVQAINNKEQVKVEGTTVSIGNMVTEDSKGPLIEFNKTGMSTTGSLTIKDNFIKEKVQPTENLNASAKISVDTPVEG